MKRITFQRLLVAMTAAVAMLAIASCGSSKEYEIQPIAKRLYRIQTVRTDLINVDTLTDGYHEGDKVIYKGNLAVILPWAEKARYITFPDPDEIRLLKAGMPMVVEQHGDTLAIGFWHTDVNMTPYTFVP